MAAGVRRDDDAIDVQEIPVTFCEPAKVFALECSGLGKNDDDPRRGFADGSNPCQDRMGGEPIGFGSVEPVHVRNRGIVERQERAGIAEIGNLDCHLIVRRIVPFAAKKDRVRFTVNDGLYG